MFYSTVNPGRFSPNGGSGFGRPPGRWQMARVSGYPERRFCSLTWTLASPRPSGHSPLSLNRRHRRSNRWRNQDDRLRRRAAKLIPSAMGLGAMAENGLTLLQDLARYTQLAVLALRCLEAGAPPVHRLGRSPGSIVVRGKPARSLFAGQASTLPGVAFGLAAADPQTAWRTARLRRIRPGRRAPLPPEKTLYCKGVTAGS